MRIAGAALVMVVAGAATAEEIEEVVVTAQKRAESLVDVPLSVEAVQGEKLAEAGIVRLDDLKAYVPNLQVTETGIANNIYVRGIGSGLGKTAGRGHKGQKSRAGGYHKVGFEGGQMPMHRRLPKRGFKSALLKYNAEITLSELQALDLAEVDVLALKQVGLVAQIVKNVKVIKSGELSKKVVLKGVGATAGAKAAIEAAGGQVA